MQSALPDASVDVWPETDATAGAADHLTTALLELMRAEYAAGRYDSVVAIARIARERIPTQPQVLRLLRLLAAHFDERTQNRRARSSHFHLAVAKAQALVDESRRHCETVT
jgi:hypothetical protein